MDEVLERLVSATVSEAGNGGGYDLLYKNRARHGSQDERRSWILESQKKQRNDKLDRARGILQLVEEMETDDQTPAYRPRAHVAGFTRASPAYRDMLMMSEWMVERPDDLHDSWYLVPCPKGSRTLVVATRGRTRFYSKCGRQVWEGYSALPGGAPGSRKMAATVLDCVWVTSLNTAYVLDLLAWNNQPMSDCDTEFRQYWLNSQMREQPRLSKPSKNHIGFTLLPAVPATNEDINKMLSRAPLFPENTPALDGLLFYHKRTLYTPGSTPLVGWLYPFMVKEILDKDMIVSKVYEPPPDYTTQADYILKFEEIMRKKETKRRLSHGSTGRRESTSDIADPTDVKTTTDVTPSADVDIAESTNGVETANGDIADPTDVKTSTDVTPRADVEIAESTSGVETANDDIADPTTDDIESSNGIVKSTWDAHIADPATLAT